MSGDALYFRYLKTSILSQIQYRVGFILSSVTNLLFSVIEFVSIWILFDRFGGFSGWSLCEVAFMYGLINTAFALSESLARGFDTFSSLIKRGDFDRILLRPRSAALQVAARDFEIRRIGRFSQGVIILLVAAWNLEITWSPLKVLLVPAGILSGICTFYGLFVFQATLSFWSTETLELMNILTYGGTEAGQYPMDVYKSWFRNLFVFIVPLAGASYFPTLVILGKQAVSSFPGWFLLLSPLFGVLFLSLSLLFWQFGIRHYTSTGS